MAEIELYAQHRSRFGQGESACMAVAQIRGWLVASDDRAVRRAVTASLGADRFLDTKGLLETAMTAGLISKSDLEEIFKKLFDKI